MIDRDIYKYRVEATYIDGCIASDFISRRFRSMAAALRAFDAKYSRKGFEIIITKDDPERCYEPIVARIVKSTYR